MDKDLKNIYVEKDFKDGRFFYVFIWDESHHTILFRIVSDVFNLDEGTLYIKDSMAASGYYNRGLGSIAMVEFKKLCKDNGIRILTGDIISDDWWNIRRIKAFYNKHGFTFSLNKTEKTGKLFINLEKKKEESNFFYGMFRITSVLRYFFNFTKSRTFEYHKLVSF